MQGRSLVVLIPLLLTATTSRAQQVDPPPPAAETVDVADLWRAIRHKPPAPPDDDGRSKRAFVIAPTIGIKPDTGPLVGVAGNVAGHHGDPSTTRISTNVFSFSISAKGQRLVNVRASDFTSEDRWWIAGDNRFQWTSQDTFGLGTSSNEVDAVNAKYDFFRINETVYRRASRNLFVGGGLRFNSHTDIRPGEDAEATWNESPSVVYSEAHGLPIDSGTSSGLTAGLRFDSRDSQISATRGLYFSSGFNSSFNGFLGGDSTWQSVDFDVRTYRTLTEDGRSRLAVWMFGDFIVNGVAPYYDLPSTGMDAFGRAGRGYPEGRFRGDKLMYTEVEYRRTLTSNGLVGMVLFLNATTVSAPDDGESLFHVVAPGAGLGARLLLNKRSGTNLCFDVGWGREGSHGVYLAVQEVF